MRPDYLGDGAYIQEGSYKGEIVIYTTDGVSVNDRVVLGEYEIKHLEEWLHNWHVELAKAQCE